MVEVKYNGRLGNQMFQYALGRIFAEELGFRLSADPLPFANTQCEITGKTYLENGYYFRGHECDINHILNNRPQKKIVLDGYFQRSSYYWGFWDKIKMWFDYPIEELKQNYRSLKKINEDDILIYIRLSDYVTIYKWALTAQFYHAAIEMASHRNVYIVTDDFDSPYLKEFEKYNPIYLVADPLINMFCGSLFNKVIISCSTFSWWGAMLSNAREIYFPLDEDGIWCHSYKEELEGDIYRRNLDLRIDESSITYFYNCPTVATHRHSPGLLNLNQVMPKQADFHKNSKAFCFI